MARTIRVILTAAASVLLVFGGAIFSPSARALAPSTYIAKTVEAAQGVQRDYKVPASVALAQSILESGWGDSSLSRDYDNYFGIKCTTTQSPYQAGCVSMRTMEYYASGATYITDGFRTYDTALDSFNDYGRLLTSLSRYGNAFKYTDNPDQFVREVAQGGYATDPAYADLVIKIMRQYDLYKYNALPAGSKPTAAATTATSTATPTVTSSASVSATVTPSASASVTPSASVSVTVTPSASASATVTPSTSASASVTVTPSASASASATVTPSASASASASVTVTPSASASASATVPPATGDIDPVSPADINRVVWVIDADARKIYFTGPVLNGEGKPHINSSFQVVDTTGAGLGTVTTDAQGWLGDSLTLPADWDDTTNFEVKIVIPGGAGTQYTEGATTIENPTTSEPKETGTLTDADPEVSSSTDTGLDRDLVPEDKASASGPASASAFAPASASASAPASAALPELPELPASSAADAVTPTVSPFAASSFVLPPDTFQQAVDAARTDSEPAQAVLSADRSDSADEQQDQVSVADQSTAPRSSDSDSDDVHPDGTSGEATNPVDRTAEYVTARLPRTGGPAAVFGVIGVAVTVCGAALLGTSLSGRGRRDAD